MLNLGGGELLLLFVLGLLLFGPRKLPEIGRTVGKAMREFRSATHNLQQGIEREVHMEDLRKTRDEIQSAGNEVQTDLLRVARGASGLAGTCEEDAGKSAPPAPPSQPEISSSEPQAESDRPAQEPAETGEHVTSRDAG